MKKTREEILSKKRLLINDGIEWVPLKSTLKAMEEYRDQSTSGVLTKGEIYYDYEGLCENLNVHMREKNNELRVDFLKTLIQDYSELFAEEKLYCTCGNPSEEGNCHFEGDEKLIYECADCGKPTKQS